MRTTAPTTWRINIVCYVAWLVAPPPTLKEGNVTHLQVKHTYTSTFVCVTHMSVHTHVYINIDTDINIHVHLYIHKHIRIHIYTHLLNRFTRLDSYTMRDMTQLCDLVRGSPPHLEGLTLLFHTWDIHTYTYTNTHTHPHKCTSMWNNSIFWFSHTHASFLKRNDACVCETCLCHVWDDWVVPYRNIWNAEIYGMHIYMEQLNLFEKWRMRMWDMSLSCVRRDSFICETCLSHVWDMTHSLNDLEN